MPVMDPPVAGEQPQPQTQTVPAGGVEPQRQEPADFTSVIDGLTDATAIGDILFGNPIADAEPAGPASGDTPQEQADPVAEPPAGAQPQEPATEPPAAPAEPTTPSLDRISLKSLHPDDRVLLAQAKDMVRDGKAPRLADAIQMLTQVAAGTPEPSPAAQATEPATPETAPAAQPDESLAYLENQLTSLEAERDKAIEEFDRPTEMKITKEIEKLNRRIAKEEALEEINSRETVVQQQTLQAAVQDIYAEYPDSEDPKSYFSYRLTQEVQDYEQAHGPITRHPSQLRLLADRVNQEVNGTPAATPQTQTPAAPPPRQVARPLGTAAPGSSGTVRPSKEMLQRLIDTADDETILKVLAAH